MRSRLLAICLAAAGAAYGADWEFDHVVKAIESHFGVERTHIPFLGVANFVLKVAHPAGASGFKLAVFEDLPTSFDYDDQKALDRFMEEACTRNMRALVVTRSRPHGEATYILSGDVGKTTRLLIATFERNEATVVQVEVNFETLIKIISSHEEAMKISHAAREHDHDEDDGR